MPSSRSPFHLPSLPSLVLFPLACPIPRSQFPHVPCLSCIHTCLRRSGALAAFDNGGVCNFPYCGCLTKWGRDFPEPQCLQVSLPEITDMPGSQVLSWTVENVCPPGQPVLSSSCEQNLAKIEINTFAACRWTKTSAEFTIGGVTRPLNPTFDGNSVTVTCGGVQVGILGPSICTLIPCTKRTRAQSGGCTKHVKPTTHMKLEGLIKESAPYVAYAVARMV